MSNEKDTEWIHLPHLNYFNQSNSTLHSKLSNQSSNTVNLKLKPNESLDHITPFRSAIEKSKSNTDSQTAYLRHSWNRIDFIAIVAFWCCFILATIGWESEHRIYLFRALSVLRAARLLTITVGTSVSITVSHAITDVNVNARLYYNL